MEESIKDRLLLILTLFSLILLVSLIGSCRSAVGKKSAYDREMLSRLDKEEELLKVKQEKATCLVEMDVLRQSLAEEKTLNQRLKNDLLQEQSVNQALQEELQKVNGLKAQLEEDLKELLAKGRIRK